MDPGPGMEMSVLLLAAVATQFAMTVTVDLQEKRSSSVENQRRRTLAVLVDVPGFVIRFTAICIHPITS